MDLATLLFYWVTLRPFCPWIDSQEFLDRARWYVISILQTSLFSGQKSVLRKYSTTAEQQSCMQKERESINSNIFNNCLVISFLSHLEADSYCFWSLLCSGSNISNLDALHQTHLTCSDCTQFKSQFLDLRNNLSGYLQLHK